MPEETNTDNEAETQSGSGQEVKEVTDTDYSYISGENDSANVKLIKNYALFLFKEGEDFTPPTGVDWTPPANKKPIGYSSEDGAVLHPEPGDTTDYKGHNGDIVVSETEPGYWTLQLAGIEARKDVIEAYFDVDLEADGGISITGAGLTKQWGLVLAALDQSDRPLVLYATNAKVSERDDVSMKNGELMQFSITFKLLKGSNNEQFHAWGFAAES